MSDRNGLVLFKDSTDGKIKAEDLDNNFRRVNVIDGENYIIQYSANGSLLSFPYLAVKITEDQTGTNILGAYKNGELKSVFTENKVLGEVGSINIIGWWV
jgi:hypothetical protein